MLTQKLVIHGGYVCNFFLKAQKTVVCPGTYSSSQNARETPSWFPFLTYPEEKFCPKMNWHRIMEKVIFSTTTLEYAYHAAESEAAANPDPAATLEGSHKSSSHQFPQYSPLHVPIRIMFHVRKRSWNSLALPSCAALRTGVVALKIPFLSQVQSSPCWVIH